MRMCPQVCGIERKIPSFGSAGTHGVMPSYNFALDLDRFAPGFSRFA